MRAVLFLAMLAATALPATAGAAPTNAEKNSAKRISTYIQQSGQLKNYRIGVTYKNGVATLAGTVTDTDQRDTAIRLAKQVKGVKKVDCQLEFPAVAKNDEPSEPATSAEEPSTESTSESNKNADASAGELGYVGGPAVTPQQRQQVRQASAQQQQQQQARVARNGFNRQMQQRPRMMPPRRNNMPLPQRRMQDPSIRQTSGVYQAGGGYACEGPGGPMMGGMGGYGGGMEGGMMGGAQAVPAGFVPHGSARGPSYENAQMPGYAWPSYASYPNYAALSYPQQYSPTAWPYIGPFYPYPQVPLAWRKVSLEWDDGWWFLDFSAHNSSH
jgi:hypothetical protein